MPCRVAAVQSDPSMSGRRAPNQKVEITETPHVWVNGRILGSMISTNYAGRISVRLAAVMTREPSGNPSGACRPM
jgi:hypothetical protein